MGGLNRIGGSGVFTQSSYDTNMDAIELESSLVAGRGILSGLIISAGTGLTLEIASGTHKATIARAMLASQHVMPANSTLYVWMDDTGAITTTVASTDLGGTNVCLGRVTTSGVAITSITDENRYLLPRFIGAQTFVVGNNVGCWDLANSRLGIGTGTPGQLLDVAGNARAHRILLPEQAGDPSALISTGQLYTKLASGRSELFSRDNVGPRRILTESDIREGTLGLATSVVDVNGPAHNGVWTALRTHTIPAALLAQNRLFTLVDQGLIDRSASGPAVTLRYVVAGTPIQLTPTIGSSIATVINGSWSVWLNLFVLSTGGSGQIRHIADQEINIDQTTGFRSQTADPNHLVHDTSTNLVVTLEALWGGSAAGNSIRDTLSLIDWKTLST